MLRILPRLSHRGSTPSQHCRPCMEALDDRMLLSATPAVSLLVPAYFYPVAGGGWDRMATAARSVAVTAILNPDSGPGSNADPVYVTAIRKLHHAGGRVIGYIHTSYGKRSLSAVEAEARAYASFYPLDGIFVDEMPTDAAHVSYYHALYAYIKKRNSHYAVMANPGTTTRQTYLTAPTADILVDFESNQGAYASAAPASWVSKFSSQHFANIVGRATALKTMNAELSLAQKRHAGFVYVTDQNLNDDNTAYDRLPVYWNQEVAAIKAENG